MQLPQIPFEIILAALFFLLPALGNLLKKRSEGAKREQKTQSRNPDTPTSEDRPSRPSPQATTLPKTTASPAEDWLEQARRRVAEAQQREAGGQRGTSSQPLIKPRQPKSQGTAQRQTKARTRPQTRSLENRSLETRRPVGTTAEAASLEGQSLESRREPLTSLESSFSSLSEAPPIRVQRLDRPKHATIPRQELRFDAHDIAKGLIWHQVLSPPRSTLRRTRLSRRRP